MPIPELLPTPPPSPQFSGFPFATSEAISPEDRIGWILSDWLKLLEVRGLGAYGAVYTAVDIRTNTPLAVKALTKAKDLRQRQFQQREFELHHAVSNHPNVVSFYRVMETEDTVFVVLELCTGGDLFSNITEKHLYQDNDALVKHTFLQVCQAVKYCHEVGIYHRDLKPENVLVSTDGSVKLADFGLATKDSFSDDFGCGSTFYMSPECQKHPYYTERYASAPNDIWSLGIMLVNLTCGRNPWKRASLEDSTYRAFRNDPTFLQSILPISPELNAILSRIFEVDPAQRISIPELEDLVYYCPRFLKSSVPVCSVPMVMPPTYPSYPQGFSRTGGPKPTVDTSSDSTAKEPVFGCPRYTVCPPARMPPMTLPSRPLVSSTATGPEAVSYPIPGHPSQTSSDSNLSDAESDFSVMSDCSSISSTGSWAEVPAPAPPSKPSTGFVHQPPPSQEYYNQPTPTQLAVERYQQLRQLQQQLLNHCQSALPQYHATHLTPQMASVY